MERDITYDIWLPYDDYEKAECDVKLRDGSVVLHCWPNAGKFNTLCAPDPLSIPEEEVVEIRYRHYYAEDLCQGSCNQDLPDRFKTPDIVGTPDLFDTVTGQFMDMKYVNAYAGLGYPHFIPKRQDTFIRNEPKIGRNQACPCGSGKKYKKCCLNQKPNQE